MNETQFVLIFFLFVILISWIIISHFFKIPFLAKKEDTPQGYYKRLKERKEALMKKLEQTLSEIDQEKGDYHNDWNTVEIWKRHIKRDLPEYDDNSIMDDEIYRLLIETLDVGLADIKAGKNPYDSEHLLYEFAPGVEKSEPDKKIREI